MDPSRGDSRYNINYSMSSIGISLADQADMYGNPAAVAALGGRPPSTGILQNMGGSVAGSNLGIASRTSNLLSNAVQCQSLTNNSSGHSGQPRGLKRSGSECYDEPHRVGNASGSSMNSMQNIDNCVVNTNMPHTGQQQQTNVGAVSTDNVDDGYNALQNKKSPPANGKKTKGRVKIKMEYIDNKLRRYTTFSKRKTGIMKKAYELSTLTGTQVMLLVASETGHVYTFATRKLQPMITSEAGKQLIQTCLNSPDPPSAGGGDQRMSATGFEETELSYNITDEDSKEMRSPVSSLNDSDDSSDIDGLGHISNFGTLNESNSSIVKDIIAKNSHIDISRNSNCSVKNENNVKSVKQTSDTIRKHNDTKDISLRRSDIMPNVTQDVLLQLIEAGHLQVHTEEDGSGLQYIAIPLSPETAELIQSNKNYSASLQQNNAKSSISDGLKVESHSSNIKEELN